MRVGIAGAGILGQLLALVLMNAGWEATLFDFKTGENCSETAAGLLTPITELEKTELSIFKLGMEALTLHWPRLIQALKSKVYFKKRGSLMLSHYQDHADLNRAIRMISSKLSNDRFYKKLTAHEITELEPSLSKFQQAYYFPEEGQLDSQKLLEVLGRTLIKKNVTWHKNTFVYEVQPGKIVTQSKSYLFDLVLDCRGLGAKKTFKELRSVRGELIWLSLPKLNMTRPIRLMHPRYSLYIAPRPRNQYIIGASEIESEDTSPISVRTALELLTAAYSITPSFGEARIIKTATHCRPALADHLPKIKYCEGLLAINGLYRHGFLIAPTLAFEISQWIEKGMASVHYPELWEKAI
ncbi:MAG: thiO [Gammaproteobacteria bacterium]|jgi:glycine oxidase|nr:thiO [Gammaproteobacteria bacterium]